MGGPPPMPSPGPPPGPPGPPQMGAMGQAVGQNVASVAAEAAGKLVETMRQLPGADQQEVMSAAMMIKAGLARLVAAARPTTPHIVNEIHAAAATVEGLVHQLRAIPTIDRDMLEKGVTAMKSGLTMLAQSLKTVR